MNFSPSLDGFVGGGGMLLVTEVDKDRTVGGEVWSGWSWSWSALLRVK